MSKFITIILRSEFIRTPKDVLHEVITFLGLRYPRVETRQFYHQQQEFSSGNPHLTKKIKHKPHQPVTSNRTELTEKNCVSLRGEWPSIDRDFTCDKVTMGEGVGYCRRIICGTEEFRW